MLSRPHALMAGFTIVEVLIAMAVLAIGMIGVVAAFAMAIDLHKRGVDQVSAALLAETILELKQSKALEGLSCDEMSTIEGGVYVFKRSENYPAYECKIICTDLSEREYKLAVEVRMNSQETRIKPASDTEEEGGNVRFDTILLKR